MNDNKCKACGCDSHCEISCTECWDCPDCKCNLCDDGIEHTKEYYDKDRNR